MLAIRNMVTEMKNDFDLFISRLDTTKEESLSLMLYQ